MELHHAKIAFLGDSITFGHGTTCQDARFTHLIAVREGAVCENFGISGTRLARQKKPSADPNFDRYFLSRVEDMPADADAVVVFGGTNDFGHGDAPLGEMADRTLDTYYGALHLTMQALIERYSGRPIVFLTPLHRLGEDDDRGNGSKQAPGAPLSVYVAALRQVAAYYSLPVIDLYATSGLQPAVPVIRERFMPDGLHPNDAGHKILADRIIAGLKAL